MNESQRYTVTASSLGSYFGVGFNTPADQLLIDTGVMVKQTTEEDEERMAIGNIMEDACLNVIEYKLNLKIFNRNVHVEEAMNGMLRFKIDGETVMDGEPTIVESKFSNATSGKFTSNKGYIFQCQAYMMAKGYNQALLCGLYEGKPIWKLIKRDEDMIADIQEMVSTVYGILNGMATTEDFPWELANKYSSYGKVENSQDFDDTDWVLVERLADLGDIIKVLEEEKSTLQGQLKDKYESVEKVGDDFKIIIAKTEYAGKVDLDKLLTKYTDINVTEFVSPPTYVKSIRVYKNKKKVA